MIATKNPYMNMDIQADLPIIEKLYFQTEDLLQKKHLQDAIELLTARAKDENLGSDTRVILNTFAGTIAPDDNIQQGDNY